MTDERHRCPRCKLLKPRTEQFFYFDWRGRVTGYCRDGCHAAWGRERLARMSAEQRALEDEHHREAARRWWRRTHGVSPDRYRVGVGGAA